MTMPGDYSEELVELVARKIHATISHCRSQAHLRAYPDMTCPAGRHLARLAVDALSSSGRLVPEGSEVREEFGVRSQRPGFGVEFSTPQAPECRDEDWARDFAEFVPNPQIMLRRVITTLWTPTEPEEAPNA